MFRLARGGEYMNDERQLMILGLLISSALFLAGVFIGGLVSHNPAAWKLAILATGLSFVAYYAQLLSAPRMLSAALVGLSIGSGIMASIAIFLL